MGDDSAGSDLFWPADSIVPSSGSDATEAAREVASLLPSSLRRGADAAIGALGAALHPRERPTSVVSCHMEGERRRDRERLILVTDRRVLIADLKGETLMAWGWKEIDSFSTRTADPGVLTPASCVYVFRFQDGRRVTLADVGPQRRGYAVGRRISWHVRTSKLAALPGAWVRARLSGAHPPDDA